MIYIVRFILLFLHLVFEENSSRNIVRQVVQELLKAAADLQCVSISILVFVTIKKKKTTQLARWIAGSNFIV